LIKHDWSRQEITEIYKSPLLELIFQAASVKRQYYPANEIQTCHLVSVKTGGCQEDCKYCAQSSRYSTSVNAQPMMEEEEIIQRARKAKAQGISRICLGAAWRGVREGPQLERLLKVITRITEMGLQVCCAFGMLTDSIAQKLANAGLYAYNHNLDTSPEFYQTIITTRTYRDRLKTLDCVKKAGLSVCCGGIIGLGESVQDRIGLIQQLAQQNPHPDSVPINILTRVLGTPLENQTPIPIWDFLRVIATARVTMPKSMIRLSAGRLERSLPEQALCFLAGANSIHTGEKLLTVANPSFEEDNLMLELFGLEKMRTDGKVTAPA
jgi:biotin synthase